MNVMQFNNFITCRVYKMNNYKEQVYMMHLSEEKERKMRRPLESFACRGQVPQNNII